MGTRNLSLCKKDGKIRIAQYGQWDGYPSGQGARILKFCQDKENLKRLEECLPKIHLLTEIPEFIEEYNALCGKTWTDKDNRTQQMKDWFSTLASRDIGGYIFENIISLDKSKMPMVMGDNIYINLYEDLDKTENYCDVWIEYAYLINFDTRELECYGHKTLLKKYSFDNLPSVDDFIKELDNAEGVE